MSKVLVVEDDRVSRRVLAAILDQAGHEAVLAESIAEARQRLDEHVLVDLMILDNQLGRDWGWELLRDLRKHPVYKALPVVVYTAFTDRSSVVRFVEFGVQGLRVKPYQGKIILEDVAKCTKSAWYAPLFETPAQACERLKVSLEDYCALLNSTVPAIEQHILEVRRRLTSLNDPVLWMSLNYIRGQGASLGVAALGAVVDATGEAITREDYAAAAATLRLLDPLLPFIRQRALAMLGMSDAVARGDTTEQNSPDAAVPASVAVASPVSDAFSRKLAATPVSTLAPVLDRLLARPVFSPEERDAISRKFLAEVPLSAVVAAVRMLDGMPGMSNDAIAQVIEETPGFAPTYKTILDRLGHGSETTRSAAGIRAAVEKQGGPKALSLVVAARMLALADVEGPIDVRPLARHSIAVSLLCFEIGRLLKLTQLHRLAAAGAVHDIGKWFFTLAEPGIYAVAHGIIQGGRMTEPDAEVALFGVTHGAAGHRLLKLAGLDVLFQHAAEFHEAPGQVPDKDHVVTVAGVWLADLLVHAATAGEATTAKRLHDELSSPAHGVWRLLTAHGVDLPFEVPELIDTLRSVAGTSVWIAEELLRSREGAARNAA